MQVKNFSIACSRNEQVQHFQVSKTTSSNHQTSIVSLIINVNHKARKEIPLHEIERNEKNTHRTWKNQTNRKKEHTIKEEGRKLISTCSLLSSRCTVSLEWKGRDTEVRPGPGWKAMRNLSEMTSARPSSSAKGLVPEKSCIVWRKKGSRFSSLSLSVSFYVLFFFSPANLARVSRKGIPGSARAAPLPMMTSDSDCEASCTKNEWIINWSWDESRNGFYFDSSFVWNFWFLLSSVFLLFLRDF